MVNMVTGGIDIVPPLTWSEVQPAGFMVLSTGDRPSPIAPDTRLTWLRPIEEKVNRPEGVLYKYTFDRLEAATADLSDAQHETFRAEVAEIIAAFPTHAFGGVDRTIRFRGDQLDDNWRVRLMPDGTVQLQVADLTWRVA